MTMSCFGTIFAIAFSMSHDSWGNGQLVASVSLHSFSVLFSHTNERYYWLPITVKTGAKCLLLVMTSEIVLSFPVMISSFAYWLPVTADYTLLLLSICPVPKDYIDIHFGCVQSLLVLMFLWFFVGTNFVLPCALLAFILVQLMFPLTFLETLTTLGCCFVRRKLMHLFPTNVAVPLIVAMFFQTSKRYICWLCSLKHPIAVCSLSMHEINFGCYGHSWKTLIFVTLIHACIKKRVYRFINSVPGTIFSFYIHPRHA
jgi:hypothetical protein